jgi:hypothetical protein
MNVPDVRLVSMFSDLVAVNILVPCALRGLIDRLQQLLAGYHM